MAYLNFSGSLRFDAHGRKRRKKKMKAGTQVFAKPTTRTFKELKPSPGYARDDHREKYPSLMEKQIAEGTFSQNGGFGTKKESMRYTGTLIKGIATMHKSNAVPVIDEQHAKDIARMRRG